MKWQIEQDPATRTTTATFKWTDSEMLEARDFPGLSKALQGLPKDAVEAVDRVLWIAVALNPVKESDEGEGKE